MTYRYWVVRFVPDVARGEFVNIGVVCGRDGGGWASRFELDPPPGRWGANGDPRIVRPWVRWLENQLGGVAELSDGPPPRVDSGWMNTMRIRQAGSIRLSEALPVDVGSAAQGVALLFPLLVQRREPREQTSETRASLRASVRQALTHDRRLVPGDTLVTDPRLHIGRQRGRFDFGLYPEGRTRFASVWACNIATVQTVARDIGAWNYDVARLRQDGGSYTHDGRRLAVASDVPIEVVVDPPNPQSSDDHREVFAAAEEAWQRNDVRVHTLTSFLHAVDGEAVLTDA